MSPRAASTLPAAWSTYWLRVSTSGLPYVHRRVPTACAALRRSTRRRAARRSRTGRSTATRAHSTSRVAARSCRRAPTSRRAHRCAATRSDRRRTSPAARCRASTALSSATFFATANSLGVRSRIEPSTTSRSSVVGHRGRREHGRLLALAVDEHRTGPQSERGRDLRLLPDVGRELRAEAAAAEPGAPTTSCPFTEPATVSLIDALIDAANTVNRVTTPTPIISAVAVPAVRRGLRIALRRASEPVIPRRRGRGAPITRLAGRATTGPNTDTPTIVASAPSAPNPIDVSAKTAKRTSAMPPASSTAPATARRREALVRSTAVSRSTASGATRDAFHAGPRPRAS